MGETLQDCLHAAGCSPELCERVQRLEATGYAKELLPQLAERRMSLLSLLKIQKLAGSGGVPV